MMRLYQNQIDTFLLLTHYSSSICCRSLELISLVYFRKVRFRSLREEREGVICKGHNFDTKSTLDHLCNPNTNNETHESLDLSIYTLNKSKCMSYQSSASPWFTSIYELLDNLDWQHHNWFPIAHQSLSFLFGRLATDFSILKNNRDQRIQN